MHRNNISIMKKSLTEQIYDMLRYDITRKVIRCGEKIDITVLREKFNTSQTPIREALIKLEQEGLLEFTPNVGARVISITQKDVSQVFDVNCILDCGAITLAFRSGNLDQLAQKLKNYTEAHVSIVSEDPTDEYWHQAQSVHFVFYEFAENDALNKAAQHIEAKADILFGEYIIADSNRHCGAEEHYKIYEAVSRKSNSETIGAMQLHWSNSKLRLLKWCEDHGYK